MSHRQTRKRRRSQAFPDDEDGAVLEDGAAKYVESTGQDRLDKEREVWDAFKDEHVEGFFFLPISRHPTQILSSFRPFVHSTEAFSFGARARPARCPWVP